MFKVGDRVRFIGDPELGYYSRGLEKGKIYRVVEVQGPRSYQDHIRTNCKTRSNYSSDEGGRLDYWWTYASDYIKVDSNINDR